MCPESTVAPKLPPKWKLTFSQEFEGPKGTAPDPKVWGRDLGGGGFGNDELQSYTDGNKNAYLNGKSHLVIEARKEPTKGSDGIARDYSSARLKTVGNFSQLYGKFEARMRMPKGQGVWPAFWMLGDSIESAGWPVCGEIDILEYLGHRTTTAFGTLHGPGYSGGASIQCKFESPESLDAGFHVYGVEWEPEEIRWYVDGKKYGSFTPNDLGTNEWVFNRPQFIILNLAVGGQWPGKPDATTTFPQQLVIDYVRAYTDENLVVDAAGIEKRRAERMKKVGDAIAGEPSAIPGFVPFANFMKGGPGVAYHDLDGGNNGGQFRPKEQVDIGLSFNPRYKYSVGWSAAGEWLKYELDVHEPGDYEASCWVASEGLGGTFHLEVDGVRVGSAVQVPDTQSWTRWNLAPAGRVTLKKGKHVLRVVMDTNGPKTNSVGNLLLIDFKK